MVTPYGNIVTPFRFSMGNTHENKSRTSPKKATVEPRPILTKYITLSKFVVVLINVDSGEAPPRTHHD